MAVTKISNSGIKTGVLKYDSMLAGNAAYDPYSFQSIATLNPSEGATTASFTSIPGTYQHLHIRAMVRDTFSGSGSDYILVRFNSDSGSNYARHQINGNGTSVSATGIASTSSIRIDGTVLTGSLSGLGYGGFLIDIHDYASTTRNKTLRSFSGAKLNSTPGEIVQSVSGLWMNTNAITSITFIPGYSGFAAGTQFALYGIKGA